MNKLVEIFKEYKKHKLWKTKNGQEKKRNKIKTIC